jgi:hypothetical protein
VSRALKTALILGALVAVAGIPALVPNSYYCASSCCADQRHPGGLAQPGQRFTGQFSIGHAGFMAIGAYARPS